MLSSSRAPSLLFQSRSCKLFALTPDSTRVFLLNQSTLTIFSVSDTPALLVAASPQALSLIEEGSDGFTARHRAIAQHAISVGHPWVSAIYDECKETGDVRGLLVGDKGGRFWPVCRCGLTTRFARTADLVILC